MFIKNLKNKGERCALIAVAVLGLLLAGRQVQAASLQLSARNSNLSVGDSTTIFVLLNAGGTAINNAEALIKFPTDNLEVLSISKGGSIFSLWVEDPAFSNAAGSLSFNGGLPTPGFSGARGTVISAVVRAKQAGSANLSFAAAAVRANDGLGTDVLSGQSGITLTIIDPRQTKVKTEPVAPSVTVDQPPTTLSGALTISSLSHPQSNLWYNKPDAIFGWSLPRNTTAVQTVIGNQPNNAPRVTYSPAISSKTVTGLADGIWYFRVRARQSGQWGPIATYAVRVDTTPPIKQQLTVTYDNSKRSLGLQAGFQDATSGLGSAELLIDDQTARNLDTTYLTGERLDVPVELSGGEHHLKLLITDRAGNRLEAAATVTVAAETARTAQAEDHHAIRFDQVPSVVTSNEQLLISGRTDLDNAEVLINIKRNNEAPLILTARSGPDGSFFVLTTKLKIGNYDIWAEVVTPSQRVVSDHLYTKTIPHLSLSFGSFTIQAIYVVLPLAGLILLLSGVIFYHLRRRRQRCQLILKNKTAIVKMEHYRALLEVRRHLKKHLLLLQAARRSRLLTKEEKAIKQALEDDLDQIDNHLGKA